LTTPDHLHPRPVEIKVSWGTLFKLFAFGLLVLVLIQLAPLAGLLILAFFLAITMAPVAAAITRRGGPKWLGVTVCALVVLGSFGAFLFFVIPLAGSQLAALIQALPSFREQIMARIGSTGPVHELANGIFQSPAFTDPAPLLKHFMEMGTMAFTFLAELLVVLILAIYLLADGRRIYDWLTAFFPERQRQRVAQAAPEIEAIVFSYMGGQLVTSLLCAGYIFTVLSLLHVPNALLLAMVGGIFDVLPIIGFFLAVIPAAAMAATVSPTVAALVLVLYTIYHLVENYFIVPKVYGNRLRLSGLTVFVFCLAAGTVGGIVGVIVILPIVASFPIFEHIWLRPMLGAETVEKHEEIIEREHPTG
jgi:predicted PurR-regulated permease PerM